MSTVTIIITGSSTLKMFSFGGNPFGDEVMSMLLIELEHNCVLTKLMAHRCRLSVKGTVLLYNHSIYSNYCKIRTCMYM